ncbi:MAG TPA: LacI family DNA-binding transcriptional regulator [Clostridia bacterium]|nr:LacI family DNA-binding transcriptional regulator [Clostridia bacterium]
MATIKQIAEACGVSVASVSKALNNASDIGVETAKRIRETAKEMGYFPNAAARALKTNRSYNIGILLAEGGKHGSLIGGHVHEFFAQVINSFQCEAEANGYDVTFITRNIGGTTMSYLEHCHYRNCDGVLVMGVDFSDPLVMELMNSDIPLVTIDHVYNCRSAVLSDNVQSMRDLVHYVYSKGHRKIAFITGQQISSVTKYRLASFYKTCEELNIAIPDGYIKEAIFHEPPSTAAATRELLRLADRPSCIFYPDDFAFIGGMNEIEAHGLKIPEDISVVGYDGIYLSQVFRPRLTTLKQDTDRLGITAARLLVQAMKFPKGSIPQHVLIPGTVLEGETVKQL